MTDAVDRGGPPFETEFAWPPQIARRAYVAYVWHRYAGWLIGSLLVWWHSWIWAYRRAGKAAATNPMPIPVASRSDEFRGFLEAQVRVAGGRIR